MDDQCSICGQPKTAPGHETFLLEGGPVITMCDSLPKDALVVAGTILKEPTFELLDTLDRCGRCGASHDQHHTYLLPGHWGMVRLCPGRPMGVTAEGE